MSELRDFDRANELQVEVQKITISELQKRIAELETQLVEARKNLEWIERVAHDKKCWIVRQIARDALKGGAK